MALNHLIDTALDGPISAIRRRAASIAACVAAGIGAVFYFAQAAVLALEPSIGPVLARVAVGAAFVLIGIVAAMAPRFVRTEGMAARAQAETEGMTREQKFTLIIEALLAGFSLSSRRSHAGK